LGRGGVPVPFEGPVGAGVIGLAGGISDPGISGTAGLSGTGDIGVFGAGPTGVFGDGRLTGPGIHGQSTLGRGGTFASETLAQIQLLPQKARVPFKAPIAVFPVGGTSAGKRKKICQRTGEAAIFSF
jgi:hypothetical protein